MPKWMTTIDQVKAPMAVGLGAVLAGANPKNLLLAVAGAATIAQTGISGGEQALAYLVFAVIATVGVAAPVVIYLAMGDRAPANTRTFKGLDEPQQRSDHVHPVPDHRRQTDRRRHRRSHRLNIYSPQQTCPAGVD